jgi:pyridoxine/pyridoxamine 5'-phosphate oxidase
MSGPAPEIATALDQLATEVAAKTGSLRLAALATVAGHEPQVRHVIIRQFSPTDLTLVFYCRADDAKFGEIASHDAVELVSYARYPDCQIRLAGKATILTDAERLDRFWSDVSHAGRRDFVGARAAELTAASLLPASPGHDRAPLFRAIEVAIRRIKVLTFEQERWVERVYLPYL